MKKTEGLDDKMRNLLIQDQVKKFGAEIIRIADTTEKEILAGLCERILEFVDSVPSDGCQVERLPAPRFL